MPRYRLTWTRENWDTSGTQQEPSVVTTEQIASTAGKAESISLDRVMASEIEGATLVVQELDEDGDPV